jgi:pimeloyl-ACP methyl ester carboxylesterase
LFPDYSYRPHFYATGKGRMHYVDEGQGPVVLLLHGNPSWSYYYRHLIAALKEDYRVIAPDHLGCGLSDKPTGYQYILANHIRNIQGLLRFLQVRRFSLVVHDWGGAIGMGVAGERPYDVEKITVLNTAAFRSKKIPLRIRFCRIPLLGECIVRGFNGFAWPATFMAVTKKMRPEVARAYIAPYNSWHNRIAIHRFVLDIPLSSFHQSYQRLVRVEKALDRLRELGVPVQIIWGGKDFCFNDHFYKQWQKRFPDAERHYFADAGHYVLEDKPGQVIELIESFLSSEGAR